LDPAYYGLVEMGFTLAAVLIFGFWQLYSVRQPKRDANEAKSDDKDSDAR
jgi:hypothetical protein